MYSLFFGPLLCNVVSHYEDISICFLLLLPRFAFNLHIKACLYCDSCISLVNVCINRITQQFKRSTIDTISSCGL